MDFFKKRRGAVIITAAVVIIFTVIGAARSLNKETKKIEKMFYSGVYNSSEDYTEPSISSQIDKRIDASLGLCATTEGYEQLSDAAGAVSEARRSLIDARSIEETYLANNELERAYQSLKSAIDESGVEEKDRAAVESYTSTMDGAQSVIEKSSYNSVVREYINHTLGAFPAKYLKVFAKAPQYFNVEG